MLSFVPRTAKANFRTILFPTSGNDVDIAREIKVSDKLLDHNTLHAIFLTEKHVILQRTAGLSH